MGREFKELGKLMEPEGTCWVRINPENGKMEPISLERHYAEVAKIELSTVVPEDIVLHFDAAKNLMVYSWYCYRFGVISEFYAYISVEFALRKRLGFGNGNFPPMKVMLKKAEEGGLIRKDDFKRYQELELVKHRREEENELFKKEFKSEIWAPMELDDYLERLKRYMPALRNEFAHGTACVWKGNNAQLRECADLINQLFQPPAPEK